MIINTLNLNYFRNIDNLTYNPGNHLNILVGENGQGKTNILESIYFLSSTRSPRVNDIKLMIKNNYDSCSVIGQYYKDKNHTSKIVIYKQGKTIYLDNQLIKKSSDYVGNFLSVLFMPNEVSLFDMTPSDRRKWIDQELVKIDNDYLIDLMNYNHYLKQRNALLKQPYIDDTYLSLLSDKLNIVGSNIIKKRNIFINDINDLFNKYYQIISQENNTVNITYKTCIDSKDDIYKQLQDLYLKAINDDKRYQSTTYGCHRDDYLFTYDNTLLKSIASQGQKRSAILAFKLALSSYMKDKLNTYPILLLDDVLSELDANHQKHLLKCIDDNQQIIITTNHNKEWFKDIAQINVIKNGRIER